MNAKTDENHLVTALLSDRPRNAKNHKVNCVCTLCTRIQAAIAAGKPPKAVARAMGHQRRLQRAKDKRVGTAPRNKREQRIAKRAMLTGAIAAQAAAGVRPNVAQAAKIAGMDPSQAQRQIRRDESIHSALARAGISDERIAQVMAEGLDAKETRLVIDKGEVRDAVEFPDWHARHKFLTAALQVKGYLVREETSATGGLIIIAPPPKALTPGHSHLCQCDECCRAWSERAKRNIAQHMRKEAITIDHVVDRPPEPPPNQDAPSSKEKTPEEKLADWEDE